MQLNIVFAWQEHDLPKTYIINLNTAIFAAQSLTFFVVAFLIFVERRWKSYEAEQGSTKIL